MKGHRSQRRIGRAGLPGRPHRTAPAGLPLRIRALALLVGVQLVAGVVALRLNDLHEAEASPDTGIPAVVSLAPEPGTRRSGEGSGRTPSAAPTTSDEAAAALSASPAVPSPSEPARSPRAAAAVPEAAAAEPVAVVTPAPDPLDPYRGLGAWVDHYDYGRPDSLPPAALLDRLAARGVRTLFLQTGRWAGASDIDNPAAMGAFVDLAHQRGMNVVAWYLPGFADLDKDLRRSLAAINFRTPSGGSFDGFASDIEDPLAVANDRARFNAGIVEYSRRLRATVPPGTVLGAIVVDARNNERAPGAWAGFPWPAIGANYDVVLPMAYWSVTKAPATCRGIQMDAAGYIRDVVAKTTARMGVARPMHPIGGIADCNTAEEVAGFAAALRDTGSIGGSLYDFVTHGDSPFAEAMWGALGPVNGLLPPRPAPPVPRVPAGTGVS